MSENRIPIRGKNGEGLFALVDESDFERLSKFKWYIGITNGYVYRRKMINRKNLNFYMHRDILGVIDCTVFVDHCNRDKLDNRRINLRICTKQQNNMNKITEYGSSKYKGVGFKKDINKWRAYIQIDRKFIHLGYFRTETECALAYNKKATELFGEFACLNEIQF